MMRKPSHIRRADRAYVKFLQGLGSVVLGLRNCSANLDRSLYQDLIDRRRKDAKRSISGDYRLERVTREYFDCAATVIVSLHDRKTDDAALVIECTFEGHFHGEPPIEREYAQEFTDSGLRIVLWPYLRQFVSDTTNRMTIAPIFLPLYLGGARDKREKLKSAKDSSTPDSSES